VTVVLTGTPNWTLKYQAGTQTFTQSGIGSGTYNIQLTGLDLGGPGTRNIQLLSVSDITGTGIVDASVYPVVVKSTFVPDIQGNFTVGAGEIRNYLTTTNTGSTYSWSWQGTNGGTIAAPTASSTNVTITTPGAFPAVYQLKVVETSSNGCTAQDVQSITVVNAPSPVITPEDANQCLNNVVTYSTPSITGHSYLWTIVGGTPATGTGNSITVTWNTIGSGSISVVENNSGITGTDVVNVVVDPMPNAALVVSTPATVCYNSPAIITVNASQTGISYQLREGAIPVGSPEEILGLHHCHLPQALHLMYSLTTMAAVRNLHRLSPLASMIRRLLADLQHRASVPSIIRPSPVWLPQGLPSNGMLPPQTVLPWRLLMPLLQVQPIMLHKQFPVVKADRALLFLLQLPIPLPPQAMPCRISVQSTIRPWQI
jgi:hypothetical protein